MLFFFALFMLYIFKVAREGSEYEGKETYQEQPMLRTVGLVLLGTFLPEKSDTRRWRSFSALLLPSSAEAAVELNLRQDKLSF